MQERLKNQEPAVKQIYPSIDRVFEEYSSDPLKDPEDIYELKSAIESLSHTDRTLITVYADTGSLKETSALLHISIYKAWKEVNRIKEEIKAQLASKVV